MELRPGSILSLVHRIRPAAVPSVIFRGGFKMSDAGLSEGNADKCSWEKATYFFEIPLQEFPPGRYWMQVNVLDPARNPVAFAQLPVAIIHSPGAVPPPAGR
jgi:hypothetical protein